MSLTQAANLVEKAVGHQDNAVTAQDISNPARDPAKYAHPTEKMLALVWQGKGSVEVVETPKPIVVESRDAILKVTGSSVCGSDLHLLHGAVLQLQKGDILGHEFYGVIKSCGDTAKIAYGEYEIYKRKLSSQYERTNANTTEAALYSGNTAMMAGYSHLTGGMARGQAEYVRVPFADVNLLKLTDGVPDEKGLFLSDVLSTSWHYIVDTGVKKDDVVAIWGAGPIGHICAEFAFLNGASRVIIIDCNWRLDYVKKKIPKVKLLNFSTLPHGTSVVSKLKEMVLGGGPNVALECMAGEYPKGWAHYFKILTGAETDTSELINEIITSVKSFRRYSVTGVYVGFTNHFNIGALIERGIRLIGNGQAPVHLY